MKPIFSIGGRVNGVSISLRPAVSPPPPSLPQPSLLQACSCTTAISPLPDSGGGVPAAVIAASAIAVAGHVNGMSLCLRPLASPPPPRWNAVYSGLSRILRASSRVIGWQWLLERNPERPQARSCLSQDKSVRVDKAAADVGGPMKEGTYSAKVVCGDILVARV